jgi:hypothetical protein
MQVRIDGELMALSWHMKDGYALSPTGKKAISRIRDLRAAGWEEPTDPDVRRAVYEALARGASK